MAEPPDERGWRRDDVTVTDEKVIKRAVGAAAIGDITEWYDFGVYSYLVTIVTDVFFSGLPQAVGTIAAFGLFAVSFLVRPIGGLIFGPLGDRLGRTKVLSVTVIMMAVGTFLAPAAPRVGPRRVHRGRSRRGGQGVGRRRPTRRVGAGAERRPSSPRTIGCGRGHRADEDG